MQYASSRRIAVRAIILFEGKLFCVRQKKYPSGEPQDYWCTPGGGVDIGEPLLIALDRELIEETGIKPVIGNLLFVQQFQNAGLEHLEFFYNVTNGQDYKNIKLDETTHGALEIAEVAFIDPSTDRLLPNFLTSEDLDLDARIGTAKCFSYLLD